MACTTYFSVLLIGAVTTVTQPHEYAMSIAEHRCSAQSIDARGQNGP